MNTGRGQSSDVEKTKAVASGGRANPQRDLQTAISRAFNANLSTGKPYTLRRMVIARQ